MVVPYLHTSSLDELGSAGRAEIMEIANASLKIVNAVYQPQGFNLGFNLGEAGGAAIAAHLHLHVVPRWNGDTSFMTTLSMTRVLPESLEESYNRLLAAWKPV